MSYIGNEPIVSASRTTYETLTTAGQTTFTASYTPGFLDVYLNGSKLVSTDYTATNGTSVVFNNACSLNDEVIIVAYGTFSVADTYTQDEVDDLIDSIQAGAAGDIFWENAQAVTANYTITSGKNAMSAGPITINSGVTVTVPADSTWVVV
jgi:hypothetical protein